MNDGHNLLQGGGDWTNVIIPGEAQNPGFNHKMTYEVSNLKTDAEYECLVQARNQFGWSEASRIFHFYTGKRGNLIFIFTSKGILLLNRLCVLSHILGHIILEKFYAYCYDQLNF